jgi:hypothetical protein
MGLMDKVKAQATVLAQKTQETAREGKAKFDQVQATRRADAMLRNLGALVYAERTGRGNPDSQPQIDRLIAEISAHEAANGINLSAEPTDPSAAGGGMPPQSGPTGGGFPPQSGPTAGGFPPQSGPASGGVPPQSGPAGQGFPQSGSTSFPPEADSTTQV